MERREFINSRLFHFPTSLYLRYAEQQRLHPWVSNFSSLSHFTAGARAPGRLIRLFVLNICSFIMTAILFSLVLNFLVVKTFAQQTTQQVPATTTTVSLTPAMSSSSVASFFSALATTTPEQPGSDPAPGDAGSSGTGSSAANEAGASGQDSGSISLSRGGLIAVIVVIVGVAVLGS